MSLWRKVLLIRRFEEKLLRMFESGDIFGTTHCCIGQEANAVGVLCHLNADDFVVSNHRCHGHYLAHTDDVEGLLAEMMGMSAGVVGGRGGSQHLCTDNFVSNGILGGGAPIAAGAALANKLEKNGTVTVSFLGDGTFGEGVVYETLNMAALWKLPIVYVVENNRYSQSTPIGRNTAGSLRARVGSFGIRAEAIETFSVDEISAAAGPIVERVRGGSGPEALLIDTYRFCHHSKNDDARDPEEVARWRKRDPIAEIRKAVDEAAFERADKEIAERLADAERAARESPAPVFEAGHCDPYYTSDEIRK